MSKERLTVADEDLGNGMKRCHIIDGNKVREHAMDFYWRLKEYEDFEEILRDKLTEEAVNVITASKKDFSEWLDRILWTNKKCDELAREVEQYRDLEKLGLILRLPCQIGDPVWEIVEAYSFGEVGDKAEKWYSIRDMKFGLSMLDDFGKTVFFTQSEAEEKLRELEGK